MAALELPKGYAVLESKIPHNGVGKHLATLAEHVAAGEGEMPLEELKPVLRILLGCAQRSYDPALRKHAVTIWTSLVSKRMGKTVAQAGLATLAAANKQCDDSGRTYLAFEWSCVLASHAALGEGALLEAALPKLAALQFSMYARILADTAKPDMAKAAAAKFAALLRGKAHAKTAYGRYVDMLAACSDPMEVAGGAALLLGGREAAASKDKFLEVYKERVLAATEGRDGRKAKPLTTEAFRLLFKMLTHDDFAALVPDMCRVLRRTPELYMGSLAASILHLSVDASRYVEQFTSIIVERLSSEALRADTVALVTSLAAQSSDLSALAALGSEIVQKMAGKGVKNWQERIGLAEGARVLLTLPKGKGIVPLAEEALAPVVALADKEANDETKRTLLAVLAACMRRAESLPADAVKMLTKNFESGADAVRRAALSCAAEALQATELL
eukprot:CAMPEP_0173422056 /NCGR_PEP_ID=MMETSP1357-20121228/2909_1 /TAXON_ID=77926 /ORGANISM="Hemiselmis rufescens, Strain PCC563" /LENGTH=445 /DNA_ID=CAMNT_0014385031 /DNA_START=162 /DNA_END=1496 /DNA_ORIENTATION=+